MPYSSLAITPKPWQLLIFLRSPQFCLFPECHVVRITQYVIFSDWLVSFRNMHLIFVSFHSLLAHFLFVLNNIPLSGCTTVYPFTYWRTSWLLSSFGSYKVAISICMHLSFQPLRVNTSEHDCWLIWQECQFCKKLSNSLAKWLYHLQFPQE